MGTKHNAKYVVTLTSEERQELLELVKKGKAAAYKIKHANILLASDENGENLSAAAVAKAYHCHTKTVYNLRQRFVEQGFSAAIERKKYATPGLRKMDGRAEAHVIAMACGKPPAGRKRWTFRLLADQAVALGVVESCSKSSIHRALKKTNLSLT